MGTTIYDKYHEAMRGQETVRYETHFPPNDAWYEVNIHPSEEGLSGYPRDITERKQAEEQLRSPTCWRTQKTRSSPQTSMPS